MSQVPESKRGWVLQVASRWTASLVYGAAVTLTLALYLAFFKDGAPGGHVVRLLGMVSRAFTPWLMVAYSVAREVMPDIRQVTREESLLLPALEGVLAVLGAAAFMWLLDVRDPWLDTAWVAISLLGSVLTARLWVRRVFQY
jgi:hypothetical protein